MRFFKRKEKGAFAIEAIIGITMFMLTIIAIMFMSVIIRVQSNMQYALGQTAKEMSGYFYLIDKVGLAKYASGESVNLDAKAKEVNTNIGYIVDFASDAKETAANVVEADDIGEIIDVLNNGAEDLKSNAEKITQMVQNYKSGKQNPVDHLKIVLQIFGKSLVNTAFGRYVGPIACDFLLPKYLSPGDEEEYFKQMGFVEKDGHYVDFSNSELLRDGRSINLVATYELDLSKLTFGMVNSTMKFRQVASTAAWVRPNGESLLAVEELFGQTTATITTTTISVPKPTTTTAASSDPDETSVFMPPAVVTSSVFMPPAVVTSSVFMPPAVVTSSVFMPPAVVTSSVFMPPAVVTSSVFMPPAVVTSSVFMPPAVIPTTTTASTPVIAKSKYEFINDDLIAEMESKGLKYTRKKMQFVTRDKNGQIVWLEEGNTKAGLNHIKDRNHDKDFQKDYGIEPEMLNDFLMNALTEGEIVGTYIKKNDEGKLGLSKIIHYTENGKDYYFKAAIGTNGYIVSAYPVKESYVNSYSNNHSSNDLVDKIEEYPIDNSTATDLYNKYGVKDDKSGD